MVRMGWSSSCVYDPLNLCPYGGDGIYLVIQLFSFIILCFTISVIYDNRKFLKRVIFGFRDGKNGKV